MHLFACMECLVLLVLLTPTISLLAVVLIKSCSSEIMYKRGNKIHPWHTHPRIGKSWDVSWLAITNSSQTLDQSSKEAFSQTPISERRQANSKPQQQKKTKKKKRKEKITHTQTSKTKTKDKIIQMTHSSTRKHTPENQTHWWKIETTLKDYTGVLVAPPLSPWSEPTRKPTTPELTTETCKTTKRTNKEEHATTQYSASL